ncbi:ABC transporter permease [Pacificimonas sp. ICDLI1SI03]
MTDPSETILIEAGKHRHSLDLRELRSYGDLTRFLIWRGVKVRYAQSALGVGWAIMEPLAQVLIYTLIFGYVIGVRVATEQPYFLFVFVGLVPWTFFSNALTQATESLSQNANLLSKVYFPRIILPISNVGTRLVDFTIAFVILIALLLAYGVVPSLNILWLPLLILILMVAGLGVGLGLAALAIQYRDVNYAVGFMVQLLKFAVPIVYPITLVPEEWRLLYAINPMVGVVEGFRAALFADSPMPWDYIAMGAVSATVLFALGLSYFVRREHLFADVG